MNDKTTMGRCATCKHRDANGYCRSDKITEASMYGDLPAEQRETPATRDMLIYTYDESGSFWAGPDFGCVHHEEKQ